MQRSFIRPAALAFATVALAIGITVYPSMPAQSASISISDSNCDSFTLGGTAPNQTLTCVVSNPPTCTVTGSNTGQINNPITLTASCAPAATSYVWTGGIGCATSVSSTCQDTETVTGPVNYTVKGTNANGPGPTSPQFLVTWSNTPPAAPSGCTIVQTNPSGTLPVGGGSPTLTASCSGGGPVASWLWAGGFAGGATTAVVSGSVTSTTQFTATATNAGGSTPTNYTVQVSTGGGGISCAGYNKTVVLDVNWANPTRMYTTNVGGFGVNDALVVRFTTGPNSNPWTSGSTSGKKGGISGAEWNATQPSGRHATLSASACDFGNGLFPTATVVNGSNTISMQYSVGGLPIAGYYPVLQPSTTYYVNINNVAPASCGDTGHCDMFIDFSKPQGL